MNNTLTKQDADRIQYILWCFTHTTNPMESILSQKWDMNALWNKFILCSSIDWFTQDSPSTVTVG